MIPIFVALYLTAENSTQIRWAGCVLILSGITDFWMALLQGHSIRLVNWESNGSNR